MNDTRSRPTPPAGTARPASPNGTARTSLRGTDILIRAGLLTSPQVEIARSRHVGAGSLCLTIAQLRIVDEGELARALANAHGLQAVSLAGRAPLAEAFAKLTPEFCAQRGLVPVASRDDGRTVVLAIVDPGDLEALDAARIQLRTRIQPVVGLASEILNVIHRADLASSPPRAVAPKGRGISFVDEAPAGGMVIEAESLAASLHAESALLPEPAGDLDALARKLDATQTELRRTQLMVRALLELAITKRIASREELGAAVARLQQAG